MKLRFHKNISIAVKINKKKSANYCSQINMLCAL